MEVSDKKIREISKRIMKSRMRILVNHGFYGLLLMHMKISLSDEHDTAWTDCSERIWFNPEFAELLSDSEIDYVLMHEITHVALLHSFRIGKYDRELFNIAADIVVNSNILKSSNNNLQSISIKEFGGAQMHVAPDGVEGHQYSVEEVYMQLINLVGLNPNNKSQIYTLCASAGSKGNFQKGWDYHVEKNSTDSAEAILNKQIWDARIIQAAEAVSIGDSIKDCGSIPAFAKRYIEGLSKPQTDWRQLLNEFVQDEINDYSFMPPDKRMYDSPFFMPDYNERDVKPGKILFAVDCSGSMSDKEISACYSEIKGAIEQFGGKIEGQLGFFDAIFTTPIPFENVDDLISIKPVGGGGTSFYAVFNYIEQLDEDEYPSNIVILTDGCAPIPDEEKSKGIPVLWIINNEDREIPWGKVARITV